MNKIISFTDPSIVVDSISNSDNQIVINIHRKGKYFTCPFCKSKTKRVHSKKIRRLQDLPIQGKNTILVAEARLFVCSNCKKRFIESFETNKDKAQRTDRLDKYISEGYVRRCIKIDDLEILSTRKQTKRKSALHKYENYVIEEYMTGVKTIFIYQKIKEMGYGGSYSSVKRLISKHISENKLGVLKNLRII